MSNKEYTAEGIVEYFEGLVEYMRKLGYEDPRDKRIAELEGRLLNIERATLPLIESLNKAEELYPDAGDDVWVRAIRAAVTKGKP